MDDIHVDIGEKVKEEVSTLKTGLVNDVKAEIKCLIVKSFAIMRFANLLD
jgi:hypothetical protein